MRDPLLRSARVAPRHSFKGGPVACWFPAFGTVLWIDLREQECPLAEFCVVAGPAGRFGKHPIGDIDFSYFLFRFSVRLWPAGTPVRVVDFNKTAVRAPDALRSCFSRYAESFVMRCHDRSKTSPDAPVI